MQYYYKLKAWVDQDARLSQLSVHCPACGAVILIIPIQVHGRVLDTKNSTQDMLLYSDARYPAFVPQIQDDHETGYALIQCNACSIDMLAQVPAGTLLEPKVVWPLPGVTTSSDVPEPVRSAVIDGKLAYAAGSKTGAVMSIRTVIERIQRRENVGRLSELWETRRLPEPLFDTANEPRLWGHVVAHDDFDPEAVTDEHVRDLLDFTDILLEMLYVAPARLERAKESRGKLDEST